MLSITTPKLVHAANFKIQIAEAAFAGESIDKVKEIYAAVNEKWNAERNANEAFQAYKAAN